MMFRQRCIAALFLLFCSFNLNSAAQSTASDSPQQPSQTAPVATPGELPDDPSVAKTPRPATKTTEKSEEERAIERKEQSQKMLGVVPQYSVTSRHDAPPLTSAEKFRLMARGTVNPFEFVATGFQAGLSQATDEFPEYGQGTEGYAKRYGAAFADQVSSQFFSNYFYPVLLKEDPRYFRSGEGSIKHRIVYSLEQEFVVHKDRGGMDFNYSNVLGAFSSGAISNLYYPQSERGVSDTVSRSAIALLYGSVGGLADEFWPDVHDHWVKHRNKKKKQDAANPQ
jgi:hypothetical protein